MAFLHFNIMKQILLFTIALFFSFNLFAQVGIGTTTPDASSILELDSDEAGLPYF